MPDFQFTVTGMEYQLSGEFKLLTVPCVGKVPFVYCIRCRAVLREATMDDIRNSGYRPSGRLAVVLRVCDACDALYRQTIGKA